jgi:putative aminopeptidase FrvX
MADWRLLKRLCTARGISGQEDEVRSLILKEITLLADRIEISPLGNILAFKAGEKPANCKLMLSAHMDEVGMIVTQITEDGLLKFSPVGGIDRRVLPGKSVIVGKNIPGVIGAKPIHLLEKDEREKSVPVKDLSIDIGALSEKEALEYVKPGDAVTFDSVFDASRGTVKAKALDDRAGCALLIQLMKTGLKHDAWFAFTVQEEIGFSGAKTASWSLEPDAAIVLESTTAADVPGVDKERQVCRLGEGPVISFMDRRTIYDRKLYDLAFEAAKNVGVKCQAKQAIAGGNDAGAIHVSRGGVRTIAVSLPCRYLHSAAGVIAQEDFLGARKLIAELADSISGAEQA